MGGSVTIRSCVSTRELTIATGWIAVLAIVALVATGWRKPARATANPARALRPHRARIGIAMAEEPAALHRRTPLWRRLWAVIASSGLAVVAAMVVATFIGFGASWIVITLSHMLKK
jgi:hypothetical protein